MSHGHVAASSIDACYGESLGSLRHSILDSSAPLSPVFRLRVESLPADRRSFRWTTYLLLAGIAPFAVASGVTIGAPFGTGLILMVLPLLYGISAFGMEFSLHLMKAPQLTEFSPDGLRFSGPNVFPATFAWRDLSRVRVRSVGGRRAPVSIVFILRKGLLMRLVHVDIQKDAIVAERVAAFIARYAPTVRRTGNTGILRWDPALAIDGEATTAPRQFPPDYFGAIAILGPLLNLNLAYVGLEYGFVQEAVLGWAMIGAYLLAGAVLVAYSFRCARRFGLLQPSSTRQKMLTALFIGGFVLVSLQGLLVLLFLL